jgi:predicted phage terminase large subunit-like protein
MEEIRPQPGKQEQFLKSSADIVIYGGQAGGGKTYGLLLEAARHKNNPQFGAVIFRRTSPQIRNEGGLWDTSESIYPLVGGKPRQTTLEWVFESGAKIKFAHMQYEQDKLDWQGAQIPFIGFDELTHFEKSQFFYMLSRNRSMCGINPYIRATTNPDADSWVAEFIEWWIDQETGFPIPEHDGVVRHFYMLENEIRWYDSPEEAKEKNPELADVSNPKSVTFIGASVYDNPILLKNNPEYLANLLALPKVERERLLKGNWKIRATGGNIFDRAWFDIVDIAPAGGQCIRYWDKAATEDGGKRTAGVKIRGPVNGIYYIEDVVKGQWSSFNREKVIRQTAELDGQFVTIFVEQEPGSGGKDSVEASIKNLVGYNVRADKVTGDKIERMMPLSAQAEAGNVKLVRGAWNESFLNECHNAEPDAEFLDQPDAAAGAFNQLAKARTKEFGVEFALRES